MTGMSKQTAASIDTLMSIGLTGGSALATRYGSLATAPKFVRQTTTLKSFGKTSNSEIFPSFKKTLQTDINPVANPYIPRCPATNECLPLPKSKHGVFLPSSLDPHTQIGYRNGRGGGYRQTRQWGTNGKLVKTTDWTSHYHQQHPNPHDHFAKPNRTGGTPERDFAQPFRITYE